jgi:hypothetical protein
MHGAADHEHLQWRDRGRDGAACAQRQRVGRLVPGQACLEPLHVGEDGPEHPIASFAIAGAIVALWQLAPGEQVSADEGGTGTYFVAVINGDLKTLREQLIERGVNEPCPPRTENPAWAGFGHPAHAGPQLDPRGRGTGHLPPLWSSTNLFSRNGSRDAGRGVVSYFRLNEGYLTVRSHGGGGDRRCTRSCPALSTPRRG